MGRRRTGGWGVLTSFKGVYFFNVFAYLGKQFHCYQIERDRINWTPLTLFFVRKTHKLVDEGKIRFYINLINYDLIV